MDDFSKMKEKDPRHLGGQGFLWALASHSGPMAPVQIFLTEAD